MNSLAVALSHARKTAGIAVPASLIALLALTGAPAMAQTDASDSTPHSNSMGAAVTDTVITGNVKAKLLGDDQLRKSHVKVTTTNGVVSLSGTASSAEAKQAAESDARAVDGVKSVDNQIQAPSAVDRAAGKVDRAASRTGKAVSDGWITTKVKSELLADSTARKADVSVKTRNGVVMLTGTADSQDTVDHIKDITQQVDGVKSVDTSGLKTK
jgi:hyperosmotically inducible protein